MAATDQWPMERHNILRDCLDSLKYCVESYSRCACECDSDGLRRTLSRIAQDKLELQAAVFNLLHQMGAYPTRPAEAAAVREARARAMEMTEKMRRRQAASGAEPALAGTP
ncbi:MAG TPA: spore coat protein [Limnochordia bacterium]